MAFENHQGLNRPVLYAFPTAQPEAENIFKDPWNQSDAILAIDGHIFHVHSSTLTMQSPVFRARLSDHFKEARQHTIMLGNKTYKPMLEFLKLLYPPNMIREKVTIRDENVFPILVLADEFQAINVIEQCIEELVITSENVLKVSPYALRYHLPAVLPKLTQVINSGVSVTRLEAFTPNLPNGEASRRLMWDKCRHLEKAVGERHEIITSLLLQNFDPEKQRNIAKLSYIQGPKFCCLREINAIDFHDVKECVLCRGRYETMILGSAQRQVRGGNYITMKMLMEGDDILNASKEQPT